LIQDFTIEKKKRKRLRTDIENSQSLSNDEVEEDSSADPTLSDIDSQANKRLSMQGTRVHNLVLKVQWLLKRMNIIKGKSWQDNGMMLMYHLMVLNHSIINQW